MLDYGDGVSSVEVVGEEGIDFALRKGFDRGVLTVKQRVRKRVRRLL